MYYLACCDDNGICFGYLKKDRGVSENPDRDKENLMCFARKLDANEIIMQVNLSNALLMDGYPFRVTAVKG